MNLKSLFLICTGAIAAVFAVLAFRIAFLELQTYRSSQKGEVGVDLVSAALTAMEKVSLERAPSNGIMGDPQPDQPALRASLDRARAESDLAVSRLRSLLEANPSERHRVALRRLGETVTQLRLGRSSVDAVAGRPRENRRPDAIRAAVRSMIRVVLELGPAVLDLSSEAERADPALSNPLMVAYLAAELREQAGQLGSEITVSLATRRRLDDLEIEDLDRSLGRIEVLHDLLKQRIQPYLDDPKIGQAASRVDTAYFGDGLAFVERTIEGGKLSGDYGMTTAEFAARYVPSMTAILDLRDLVLDAARGQAGATRARARAFLLTVAAGYALLLAILAMMLLRLGRRVIDAFETTTGIVVAIADGKLDTAVPTAPRKDEIGKLLHSIQVLKDGMIKRRQMETALVLSEARFRSSMHHSAIGMALVGLDARWIDVNAALCSILGYSCEELRGADYPSIVHPDDRQEGQEFVRRMLEGHLSSYEIERRLVHKDGHTVWTQLNVSLIRDDEDAPHYFVLQFQDIGERRRAAEVTSRLAAIVESSDDAIIGKSLDGIVMSWNSGAERLYGYTKDEATGRPVSFIRAPEHDDDTDMILARIKRGERVDHYETARRHKGGTLVQVSLTVSPIKDTAGRIIGASAIARDIGERKKAEEEREKLISELQDALSKVKTLSGLIPICASCKKIRDDRGYWNQIEIYIREHSQAEFSHGICPECMKNLYPEVWEQLVAKGIDGQGNS